MVKFNPEKEIPDLAGKVIVVTGGNIGLGKETILQLAKHNPAHIFLGARSEAKARDAIADIQKQLQKEKANTTTPITFVNIDLTSFESIKSGARDILGKTDEVHLLFNNAGIMATPAGTTKEGYEVQFGTNHMGHALLTKLLLPTLLKTAAGGKNDVRIITLSSTGESLAGNLKGQYDFAALKTDMASTSTWTRYGISKLANVHHSRALAKQHPELRCVSLHPGVINTNLFDNTYSRIPLVGGVVKYGTSLLFTSVPDGAKNQLWASVSAKAESGHFYFPIGLDGKGSKQAMDDKLTDQLWEWTEKEIKAHL